MGLRLWAIINCKKMKPHAMMIVVQLASAVLYLITEAAFNHGMNPHVYVTYRHVVGGLAVLPFAYFLERKTRPKLTLKMLAELFLFALLGVGLAINMYFASLKYTSPAFVSAVINTVPSLTFILSVLFRVETLDVRDGGGAGKITGCAVSLAGVMMLTLYRGPQIKSTWTSSIHLPRPSFHPHWIKGSLLCVASCVSWSIWFTMQGLILKRYPAQLSLTTWANFVGAAQSGVFAMLVTRHEPVIQIEHQYRSSPVRRIGFVWELKGPVFVTMFCPLQTLLVVVSAYFVLKERLYMGSVVGGLTIIAGLYLFLWGKAGDNKACGQAQQESDVNHYKMQSECVTDAM